jgi:hypothetical protein
MKHELKYNQFHYFEKQQLEDYLNEMAKKGKYLTKIHSQYLVFKSEPIHQIYYYIDVYSQKDGFVDVPQKEEYFEYFQSSGYELLDYCEPFYIFTSLENKPIHTDEDVEKELIRKTSHRHLLSDFFFCTCWMIILWMKFSIDVFSVSSDYWLMNIVLWLFVLLGYFVASIYPYLKYKLTKKVEYSYIHILKRSYHTALIFACLLSLLAVIIAKTPYITYGIIIGVYLLLCLIGNYLIGKTENIWLAMKIPLITFCFTAIISFFYLISGVGYPQMNMPLTTQKPYIVFQQSSLAGYVNYQDTDGNRLAYFESYCDQIYPIVFNNMLINEHYKKTTDQGYDIYYINEDDVIVSKGYRFLRGNHQLLNTDTKRYLEFGW